MFHFSRENVYINLEHYSVWVSKPCQMRSSFPSLIYWIDIFKNTDEMPTKCHKCNIVFHFSCLYTMIVATEWACIRTDRSWQPHPDSITPRTPYIIPGRLRRSKTPCACGGWATSRRIPTWYPQLSRPLPIHSSELFNLDILRADFFIDRISSTFVKIFK